jgi:hypothetical protein
MADKKDQSQKPQGVSLPALPKSYEHRASMKWITLEAVRVTMERLRKEANGRVVLITAAGMIEGELSDIAPSYAESFDIEFDDQAAANVTSMVANLRIDLLRILEKQENKLELTDAAPLIGLKNVIIRAAGHMTEVPELTLFADQICGFYMMDGQH